MLINDEISRITCTDFLHSLAQRLSGATLMMTRSSTSAATIANGKHGVANVDDFESYEAP